MPLVIVLGAATGALFGTFADRFAARWPAHTAPMPGIGAAAEMSPVAAIAATHPAAQTPAAVNPATAAAKSAVIRRVDWRTVAVGLLAAASFAGLLLRWSDPRDLAVLGVYFAALIVLAATDLDQKLLPDAITFPLIGYALVMLLIGWNPLLADKSMGLISGIAAGIGAPVLLLITDRIIGGGLGMGDIKLAVALGLMSGVSLLFAGFLIASAASSVVLIALIVSRRVGLRSAIPFGPILICGGIVAALLP